MPRLKKSLGTVVFTTVFPEEFQRWLMYELEDMKQWNLGKVVGGMKGFNKWKYSFMVDGKSVNIEYSSKRVIVTSEISRIWLRNQLIIDMGNGTIIIKGQ